MYKIVTVRGEGDGMVDSERKRPAFGLPGFFRPFISHSNARKKGVSSQILQENLSTCIFLAEKNSFLAEKLRKNRGKLDLVAELLEREPQRDRRRLIKFVN